MAPIKPDTFKTYATKWFLIVNYLYYKPRLNDYQIPMVFYNVGLPDIELDNPEVLKAELTRVINDAITEGCDKAQLAEIWASLKHGPLIFYYLEFEDADKLTEFEDELHNTNQGVGITHELYNDYIHILPAFKPIQIEVL